MMYLVIFMYTIDQDYISTLEVKKSKFIAVLKRVDSVEAANQVLQDVKVEYPNARHYTYAYIIDSVKRCSDDKEPSKTAGSPILNVLERNDLTHVICVVIRYFGGILLGAPGLVRAYSSSACNVLEMAHKILYQEYETYEILFSYDVQKKVDFLLKEQIILEKKFDTNVTYAISLEKDSDLLESLRPILLDMKKK